MAIRSREAAALAELGREAGVALIAQALARLALSPSPAHQAAEFLVARGTRGETWLDLWVMRGATCAASAEPYSRRPSECGYAWGGGSGTGCLVHFARPAGPVPGPDVTAAAQAVWDYAVAAA